MEEIAFCETCGAEQESIFHAFFECTWARQFWHELKMVSRIKVPELHPVSWASDLIDGKRVSVEDACVILCGCWAVWTERNAMWHGNGGKSISASVRWVLETTFDLAQLGKKKVTKKAKAIPSWKKPAPGILKINVDAGFDAEQRQGTSGLVIRDHDGRFILGQALWYEDAASPMVMEAQAIRDGVRLALDRHFQAVEIETDAKVVLQLIEDPGDGRSEIAGLCQEIKELSGFLASVNFSFVGRPANMAAHMCAKKASSVRRRCLWVNYTPPFLDQILVKDCNPTI
jgi:ribonuclease HI